MIRLRKMIYGGNRRVLDDCGESVDNCRIASYITQGGLNVFNDK